MISPLCAGVELQQHFQLCGHDQRPKLCWAGTITIEDITAYSKSASTHATQARIYSKPLESSPPSPTASSRGGSIPPSARSVSGFASSRRGKKGPVTYHIVTDHNKCQSTQEIDWGRFKLRPEEKSTVVDACSCSIAGTQNGAPLPSMDSACLLQAVLPEGAFGPAPVTVLSLVLLLSFPLDRL